MAEPGGKTELVLNPNVNDKICKLKTTLKERTGGGVEKGYVVGWVRGLQGKTREDGNA